MAWPKGKKREDTPYNYGKGKAITWLRAHVGYTGDDCLPWPYAKDSRVGRGLMGNERQQFWAHRLMCELAHGEAPRPSMTRPIVAVRATKAA